MEFTTLATAINHFVDIGAPGRSTGDIYAITGGTEEFRGVAGETTVELGPPGGPHKVRAVIIR